MSKEALDFEDSDNDESIASEGSSITVNDKPIVLDMPA
jgi:hypothetical protein